MERLEQVLRFRIDALSYCIDTDRILQIIRTPAVTHVPLSPAGVRGIASIEGNIVTVLDAKELILNAKEVDVSKEHSRLLTIKTSKGVLGLLVDEVVENNYVDESNIEYTDSSEDDFVIAVMKAADDILQVVDIERIIRDIKLQSYEKEPFKEGSAVGGVVHHATEREKKLLFFKMGEELFAIDIELIREIINADCDFTSIADASASTLGMFTLRDKIIVAQDFRAIFSIRGNDTEQNRIVIIHTQNRSFGLLVDSIIDIKDVEESAIELFPQDHADDKLAGVTKFDDHLVSIVSKKLIDALALGTKAIEPCTAESAKTDTQTQSKEDAMELVIFKLGREEYAFDIEDVEEIIRYGEITPIADAPQYVKGIINLRGFVIPIFSLHERLGFNEKIDDDTKILVCKVRGSKIGFLVDNVSEVLNVPQTAVAECVQQDSVFSNVIVLEYGKRMILRLAINNILDKEHSLDFVKPKE